MDIDDLIELENQGRIRRTRDFRIDIYGSTGNARIDTSQPDRIARTEAHQQRVQAELKRRKALDAARARRQHAEASARWRTLILSSAGYVCQVCGELDHKLLEAHHVIPVSQDRSREFDPRNGRCLCLWHHAQAHTGKIADHILARYARILHRRRVKGQLYGRH